MFRTLAMSFRKNFVNTPFSKRKAKMFHTPIRDTEIFHTPIQTKETQNVSYPYIYSDDLQIYFVPPKSGEDLLPHPTAMPIYRLGAHFLRCTTLE